MGSWSLNKYIALPLSLQPYIAITQLFASLYYGSNLRSVDLAQLQAPAL